MGKSGRLCDIPLNCYLLLNALVCSSCNLLIIAIFDFCNVAFCFDLMDVGYI